MSRWFLLLAAAALCAGAAAVATPHPASAATTTHIWASWDIQAMTGDAFCTEPDSDCDDDIYGMDINSKGWVAGHAFPDYDWPYVWKATTLHTVTSPGHEPFPGFEDAGYTAINTAGDTTGWTVDWNGQDLGQEHPFLFKNGAYTDIQTLQGAQGQATGNAINDSDTIGGSSSVASNNTHAFMWKPGAAMTDLGTLGGADSEVLGLNATNQATGDADVPSGARHAFRYASGKMTDLGTLGGSESVGNGIDNSGVVVGWADTAAGAQTATMWTGTKATNLGAKLTGAVSSEANHITNTGAVVGDATRADGSDFGWLYLNGTMINLSQNSVTWDTSDLRMNANLQIVGTSYGSGPPVAVMEPVTAYDENNSAIKYTGSWTRSALAGAWGGAVKTATKAGASASLTFTGKRFWWVATGNATGGQAQVYLDGKLAQTVDLSAVYPATKATVWDHAFSAVGKHTIKIVVVGTAGHPTVTIDAFAVSQY